MRRRWYPHTLLARCPMHITQGESHMVFSTMESSEDVVSDAHGQ